MKITITLFQSDDMTASSCTQVMSLVAFGRYGAVYRYMEPDTNRIVAIKIPRKKTLDTESEILTLLNNIQGEARNYIPIIYNTFNCEHGTGIIMEYVPGKSLEKVSTFDNRMLTYRIFECVAIAIQLLHSRTIIHRDVKPDNIIYNDNPFQVKLVDYGFAVLESDAEQICKLKGSTAYAAPELYDEPYHVGTFNDVWSFGVSLFEKLTNKFPIGEGLKDVSEFVTMLQNFTSTITWNTKGITSADANFLRYIFVYWTQRVPMSIIVEKLQYNSQ